MKSNCRTGKRKGAALIMVLIVLLIGSMLLATSLEIVENLFSSTQATTEHVDLYSTALDGQEWGKAWIGQQVSAENIPLGSEPSGTTADSVKSSRTVDGVDVFFPDLVVSADGDFGIWNMSLSDDIDLFVVVYDALQIPTDVAFSPTHQAPPRMEDREASIGQGSAKQGQSYSGSNRGGTGGISEESAFVVLPAYVIRSLATHEDKSFGIEGGYRLEP